MENPHTRIEVAIAVDLSAPVFADQRRVVLKLKDHSTTQDQWLEIGTTEWQPVNEHISFLRTIELECHYEEQQDVELQVWEGNNGVTTEYIAQYSTTVTALLNAGSQGPKPLELGNGKPTGGTITLQVREIAEPHEIWSVFILVSGSGLDKKDFFSSDPFLEFYRKEEKADNQWRLIHTTEVQSSTLEPRFNPIKFDLGLLCNYNMDQPFLVKCWDKDIITRNEFIGQCQVTLSELRVAGVRKELIKPTKAAKYGKNYINSGILSFDRVIFSPRPSRFYDYLTDGWKLSVQLVANYSNWFGKLGPNRYDPSAYDYALSSMANFMSPFCQDKFLVYGFGGKFDGVNKPIASLTNNENAQVVGVAGVRAAYASGLKRVETDQQAEQHAPGISALLWHLEETARNGLAAKIYTVQFIFIEDVTYEVSLPRLLVRLSRLPVSVILVRMAQSSRFISEYLDGDNKFWKADGEFAQRDIMSCVDFTTVRHPIQLKFETFRELPAQFCWYQGIQNQPLPRARPAEEEKKQD